MDPIVGWLIWAGVRCGTFVLAVVTAIVAFIGG